MNAQLDLEWRTDNQHFLEAEYIRLCSLLGDGDVQQSEATLAELREELQSSSSIDLLAKLFVLNAFERDLLLLVAAAELNPRIAALCNERQEQRGRSGVTLGLAMSLFDNAYLGAIAPMESLRRWRLLEIDTSSSTSDARLRVDERILFFIGGLNFLDHRLLTYFEPLPQHTSLMAEAHRHIAQQVSQLLQADDSTMPTIFFEGDDRDSQLDVAIAVAESMDASLHVVHTADLPESLTEQEALISLWHREAALLGSGLVIIHDAEQDRVLRSFVSRTQGFVVVVGVAAKATDKNSCTFSIDNPDTRSQRELWQAVLGDSDDDSLDLNYLANQYRLNARRIDRIAQQARRSENPLDASMLRRLCGADVKPMDALAQRIESTTGWGDLILPEGQLRVLQQLVSHTHHRMKVHYDWGFANKSSRGLGVASLFSGESGTGKTMAAEVIANELDLILYRIDLSAVVSKYIGETEKNLKKLFDAAEHAGAVLLFDEADALFGKRSDVKDSHDRYANIEVSYLLQRMEAYRGLAILTSNHRAALDVAFQRRLRFIVDFPFPDATQREAIWRNVFPSDTPLSNLNYSVLARLNATGGSIRNIALNAAFMAADSNSPVTMTHIQRAAQLEVGKSERTLSTAEIRGWV